RSMATRGSYGGLSKAVAPTVNLLGAFGNDIIIIETAGVGQIELDVKGIADVLVLVLAPGFGDAIQLMKAGLIEVADMVVVNKTDLEGADKLLAELGTTLKPNGGHSKQLIVATQALNGVGIEELYQAIEERCINR
ncbi:methylmalonyl Co-A mutase-associated GTPase MeaB, partial [Chloroflexota bacterium]